MGIEDRRRAVGIFDRDDEMALTDDGQSKWPKQVWRLTGSVNGEDTHASGDWVHWSRPGPLAVWLAGGRPKF